MRVSYYLCTGQITFFTNIQCLLDTSVQVEQSCVWSYRYCRLGQLKTNNMGARAKAEGTLRGNDRGEAIMPMRCMLP